MRLFKTLLGYHYEVDKQLQELDEESDSGLTIHDVKFLDRLDYISYHDTSASTKP